MANVESAILENYLSATALWQKFVHGSVWFLYPEYFDVRKPATEGAVFNGKNSKGDTACVTINKCSGFEFGWSLKCAQGNFTNTLKIKQITLDQQGCFIEWISSGTATDAGSCGAWHNKVKMAAFKALREDTGPTTVVHKDQIFFNATHQKYITSLASQTDTFAYWAAEYLRVSGVYWGLTAMHLMRAEHRMPVKEIVQWVLECRDPDTGGFGGNVGHDGHMLYTLSAVQVLALSDSLHLLDPEPVVRFVVGLQQKDGSFTGDKWGEVDTRFSYCALSTLALLGRLDAIDTDKAAEFVGSCRNFDGGFGAVPGAESHAGQIFTCVGALAIADRLDLLDPDLLGWWLCERQVDSGGLNGRPEKQADVCYSWWVLSSLSIIGRVPWLNADKLVGFIIECQVDTPRVDGLSGQGIIVDGVAGGISDRPDDMADVYHTFFGICGLCLLGWMDKAESPWLYRNVDPVYALPVDVVARLGLHSPRLTFAAPSLPKPSTGTDEAPAAASKA